MNKLTKQERASFEFLRALADFYLDGTELKTNESDYFQLSKLGINISRVNHNKVKQLKRGKEAGLQRVITNAPHYIRGKSTIEYLRFQVKEYKPDKE